MQSALRKLPFASTAPGLRAIGHCLLCRSLTTRFERRAVPARADDVRRLGDEVIAAEPVAEVSDDHAIAGAKVRQADRASAAAHQVAAGVAENVFGQLLGLAGIAHGAVADDLLALLDGPVDDGVLVGIGVAIAGQLRRLADRAP